MALYPNENEGWGSSSAAVRADQRRRWPGQQWPNHYNGQQFLVRHPKDKEYLRTEWEEKFKQHEWDKLPCVSVEIMAMGIKKHF